jgi:hypothetical protein
MPAGGPFISRRERDWDELAQAQLRAATEQYGTRAQTMFGDHTHLVHRWGPGLYRCWLCPAVLGTNPYTWKEREQTP